MRKPLDIPVRAIGPGSQPADEQGLDYLPFPKMETFAVPIASTAYERGSLLDAARLVEDVITGVERCRTGDRQRPCFDLASLDPQARAALNDALGQGEVSAIVRAPSQPAGSRECTRIQETAFAGVWRVQHFDPDGELAADLVEAGDIPACVRSAATSGTSPTLEVNDLPAEAMNAPALLHELRHRAATFGPGCPPHVVNLTLLPNSPEDLSALEAHLGAGPVVILSRGFGNCRITSTKVRGIWRVQYFNSMHTLILDTIEVVALPEVALAAADDLADTLTRLRELAGWLRDDADDAA